MSYTLFNDLKSRSGHIWSLLIIIYSFCWAVHAVYWELKSSMIEWNCAALPNVHEFLRKKIQMITVCFWSLDIWVVNISAIFGWLHVFHWLTCTWPHLLVISARMSKFLTSPFVFGKCIIPGSLYIDQCNSKDLFFFFNLWKYLMLGFPNWLWIYCCHILITNKNRRLYIAIIAFFNVV